MTPEQRAEKIVNKFLAPWAEMYKPRVEWIAAQIEEVVEEERLLRMDWNYRIECLEKQLKESQEAERDRASDEKFQAVIRETWNAAREKAKGILKEECEGISGDDNCLCCACQHADRIGRMEP